MPSGYRYILLIIIVTGGAASLLRAVWTSDWGQRERAWYRDYPYLPQQARPPAASPPPDKLPTDKPPTDKSLTDKSPTPVVASSAPHFVAPAKIPSRPQTAALPPPGRKTPQAPPTPAPAPSSPAPEQMQASPTPGGAGPATAQKRTSPEFYRLAERGYAAYRRGDHAAAAQAFKKALRLRPGHWALKVQLAYSHKHLGRNGEALRWLRQAIEEADGTAPFYLRREVEELSRRWRGQVYLLFRDQSDPFGPLTGANLVQSQGGAEVAWRPPHIGYRNGRTLALYGRLLWALEDGRIGIVKQSYQAGLGLRYKPFGTHNLVLSGERLIAVGDFARDDWMLRAGYSLDRGTDWREESGWWTGSLYLDAAFVRPRDPDIFLTFQGLGGYSYRLGGGLVLRPHVLLHATWQQDRFRTADLVEAGPGLSLKLFFNGTRYEAFRSHVELAAEYRFRLAGNSLGASGPVLRLLLQF